MRTIKRPKLSPHEQALQAKIAEARRRDPKLTASTIAALASLARETGQDYVAILDEWYERAAVREYLGNTTRAEAERHALDDVRAHYGSKQLELGDAS